MSESTKAKQQLPTSQLLLPLFQKHPEEHQPLKTLFDTAHFPPEDERRLRCTMGHVARRLLYDHRQLLLGDGETYWIAHQTVDSEIVRQRLLRRLKRGKSFDARTQLELRVAGERRLLPAGELRELRRTVA